MKARNHTITCQDIAHFERLVDEYTWLGENIEINSELLTIKLLARPKASSRDTAVLRARADAASEAMSEAYYMQRYNLEPPA
jgi:hypothetical protein